MFKPSQFLHSSLSITNQAIALLLSLMLSIAVFLPVAAASCRTLNNHTVCILDIQRSAKNYWQYRATITIDGIAKPAEFYNCRDRQTVQRDGTRSKFDPDGIGNFICRLYKPQKPQPLPQSVSPL